MDIGHSFYLISTQEVKLGSMDKSIDWIEQKIFDFSP
jgi:hypothetical protein